MGLKEAKQIFWGLPHRFEYRVWKPDVYSLGRMKVRAFLSQLGSYVLLGV